MLGKPAIYVNLCLYHLDNLCDHQSCLNLIMSQNFNPAQVSAVGTTLRLDNLCDYHFCTSVIHRCLFSKFLTCILISRCRFFPPQVSVDVHPPGHESPLAVVDGGQPLDESQTAGKDVALPCGVSSAEYLRRDESPMAENDGTQFKVTDGQNKVSFVIYV